MDLESLRTRYEHLESRIERAARRAGRRREDIRLIAVTKVFPAAAIGAAFSLGIRNFGENYVQEFESKRGEIGDLAGARFHLIGHLQSNKARRAAEVFDMIQTVDSVRLARRLEEALAALGRGMEVMIEVKLSAEQSKAGAGESELAGLAAAVGSCPHLELAGLMTIPPFFEDPELSRPYFRRLRELAAAHGLRRLSMGMSQDFEAAIEEGATDIRVGTALFGPREQA